MSQHPTGFNGMRWGGVWHDTKDPRGSHILFEDFVPALFTTRREARAYIEKKYGYIRNRPDLRAAPFKWRMPVAVKLSIKLGVIS